MKIVACIIARTNSTRLPKKVLIDINGKMVIEHIISQLKNVKGIDEIYIATSYNPNDAILGEVAKKNNAKVFFGSENSVIDRMLEIAKIENADAVIRVTGDNIFTDSEILEKTISYHKKMQVDYSRAEYLSIGTTAEVINVEALLRCYNMIDPSKSEYLFYYIFNPNHFKTLVLRPARDIYKNVYTSLTLDTPNDLERTMYIFSNIEGYPSYKKIVFLNQNKQIPYFNIDENLLIKLPDKETMSYGEFRAIIDERINDSIVINYDL